MSLLFESISCINGVLQNLKFHERRMFGSRSELLHTKDHITLDQLDIPKEALVGLWKCRISYSTDIEEIKFTPYVVNLATTYKLVEAHISYNHKFEDRSNLNQLFQRRQNADDIIILDNGRITDSSYGNLLFFDGKKWFTPIKPLLRGTMREKLLNSNRIEETEILKSDLKEYERFMMINALNPFDESRALPTSNIIE